MRSYECSMPADDSEFTLFQPNSNEELGTKQVMENSSLIVGLARKIELYTTSMFRAIASCTVRFWRCDMQTGSNASASTLVMRVQY